MAGLHRDRVESQEAAVKYFITGAFSSAFFLYGVALLYGVSGSTTLAADRRRHRHRALGGARAGPARRRLPAGGLRVQGGARCRSTCGRPTSTRARPPRSPRSCPRASRRRPSRAFLRVFLQAVPALAGEWQPAVAVLAIVTMVIGNLGALAQTNIKRMLAYSSVAHAGYILTAVVAAPGAADGGRPLLSRRLRGGEPRRLRRAVLAGPRRPRAAVAGRRLAGWPTAGRCSPRPWPSSCSP